MNGPYRTPIAGEQYHLDPCKVCRYRLDSQVYDEDYCMYDGALYSCKGPYLGPEPPRTTFWKRLKGWFWS
jgi:hypothetical protein